jgi:hypothetical protein
VTWRVLPTEDGGALAEWVHSPPRTVIGPKRAGQRSVALKQWAQHHLEPVHVRGLAQEGFEAGGFGLH